MQRTRRKIITFIGAMTGMVMAPLKLLAAQWNAKAFDETRFPDSLKSIGAFELIESDQIQLKTPEIAENGAIVPIQVISEIPNTETVFVFAEKNPQPLVASFTFVRNVEPFFATRIKMGESAKVHVVVRADGQHYTTSRDVKVTIGGCGE
ncbi:MAG: thiosulfate oxidation carrier protein SoxY [Betaproteobacteria bacterium]|jgi:sulfur-oxidizing protein SoxY|nr:MAG: thiosulfate oxidation carrier protein SoxY [Betaproteobacteria bacterium]